MKFSREQQQIVDHRKGNLLVSAAAGSGKTAVLVQHIVDMVTDAKQPIDIDRILVVTFTKAAAAEMRERISRALEDRVREYPEDTHLQKQITLIHNAQITTIDSFCLFVLRNHFLDIGLDPHFSIAAQDEIRLMEEAVMKDLLEEAYQRAREQVEQGGSSSFLKFVERFSDGHKDTQIEEILFRIYRFAQSDPWPQEWLQQSVSAYAANSVDEMLQSAWYQEYFMVLQEEMKQVLHSLEQACDLAQSPEGPAHYVSLLMQEIRSIEEVLDRFQVGCKLQEDIFGRLPSKKAAEDDLQVREAVKRYRDDAKSRYKKVRLELAIPQEELFYKLKSTEESAMELVSLLQRFEEMLQEEKRKRKLLDFQDMEHLALKILVEKNGELILPTKTAREYRHYFEEIIIDEYQDSNRIQEMVLSAISGDYDEDCQNRNRFMVGDVKQSIYKFRMACPSIFIGKYHEYAAKESHSQRIDLSRNYRSRQEVLASVNVIFEAMMRKEVGNVDYDEAARLNLGATFPACDQDTYRTEILLYQEAGLEEDAVSDVDSAEQPQEEAVLMEPTGEKEESTRHKELHMVARKIQTMVGEMDVYDQKQGILRKARYRDIVILARSVAGWEESAREVFREYEIPVFSLSKTGYFQTTEIRSILNFCKVIDNPLQDIPLYGLLTSDFFTWEPRDIARIKVASGRKKYLFDACAEYAKMKQESEDEKEKELVARIYHFLQVMARYRDCVEEIGIRDLLQAMMSEFHYVETMRVTKGGKQRVANLEILLAKAASFEASGHHGLFRFVHYIEEMHQKGIDEGEANILDESADVVRMMTIHKSKGLEFPICIVIGMGTRLSKRDTNGLVIVDVDAGIGISYGDEVQRVRSSTIYKDYVARRILRESIGEELRVLYVAMTRAKEKLIMTGYLKDYEKYIAQYNGITPDAQGRISPGIIEQASIWMDFLMPVLHEDSGPFSIQVCGRDVAWEQEQKIQQEQQEEQEAQMQQEPLEAQEAQMQQEMQEPVESQKKVASSKKDAIRVLKDTLRAQSAGHKSQLQERFIYRYPHADLSALYTKTTVSEIKRSTLEEAVEQGEQPVVMFETEVKSEYVPTFAGREDKVKGATRGTIYHKAMELISLEAIFQEPEFESKDLAHYVQLEIKKWTGGGWMLEEEAALLSVEKMVKFLQSDLAMRMYRADSLGNLFREQPFVLGVPANMVDPLFPKEETILVQGVIDAYFIEEGEMVVVDYKTDRVSTQEELIGRYRKQLDYYSMALERLHEKKVKEEILYSFTLGTAVVV